MSLAYYKGVNASIAILFGLHLNHATDNWLLLCRYKAESGSVLKEVHVDAAVKVSKMAVLYCTVLYCTVLYCTVLYCTVLRRCPRWRGPPMSARAMTPGCTARCGPGRDWWRTGWCSGITAVNDPSRTFTVAGSNAPAKNLDKSTFLYKLYAIL